MSFSHFLSLALLCAFSSLLAIAIALVILVVYIRLASRNTSAQNGDGTGNGKGNGKGNGAHILIVLGSGGHTAEMLLMLSKTPLHRNSYAHRTYVISSGDAFSAQKAVEFERELLQKRTIESQQGIDARNGPLRELSPQTESPGGRKDDMKKTTELKGQHQTEDEYYEDTQTASSPPYTIITVPRARKVHQSLLTAPFTTLYCLWSCLLALLNRHPDQTASQTATTPSVAASPDIVLANGPATAVCMVFAARIIRAARCFMPTATIRERHYPRIIYIESWARVKTLSLSGKIVLPFVDRFLVQWRGLKRRKTEYIGVLV